MPTDDPYEDILNIAAGSAPKSKPAPQPVQSRLPDLISFADQNKLRRVGDSTTGVIPKTGHNVGSKHYTGNAIDLAPDTDFNAVSKLAAASGFKLRNERTRPKGQKVWGGPHDHLEVDDAPQADPYKDILKIAQGSGQVAPPQRRVQKGPQPTTQPAPIQPVDDGQWGEPAPQGLGMGEFRRAEAAERRLPPKPQVRPANQGALAQRLLRSIGLAREAETPAPSGGPAMQARTPSTWENIKETVAPYVPGLASIDTPFGIKTDPLRGAVSGVTLGALGEPREISREEKIANPQAQAEAEFAHQVGSFAPAVLPYIGAGKVAGALLTGTGRLSNIARTALTFGGVEAGREVIRAAKTDTPLDPKEIAISTAIGGAMGTLAGVNPSLKRQIVAFITPQAVADYARGTDPQTAVFNALTNLGFAIHAGVGHAPKDLAQRLTKVPDIKATLARRATQRPTLRPEDVERLNEGLRVPEPETPRGVPAEQAQGEIPRPSDVDLAQQRDIVPVPQERPTVPEAAQQTPEDFVANARAEMARMEAEEAARQQPAPQVAAQPESTLESEVKLQPPQVVAPTEMQPKVEKPSEIIPENIPTESAVKPVAPSPLLDQKVEAYGVPLRDVAAKMPDVVSAARDSTSWRDFQDRLRALEADEQRNGPRGGQTRTLGQVMGQFGADETYQALRGVETPVKPVAPEVAKPEKQPWEMTRDEWVAKRLAGPDKPVGVTVRTPDGDVRTTYEDALRDKLITKKQFDKERYGGLSRKQSVRSDAQAQWHSAVWDAIRAGKPVPDAALDATTFRYQGELISGRELAAKLAAPEAAPAAPTPVETPTPKPVTELGPKQLTTGEAKRGPTVADAAKVALAPPDSVIAQLNFGRETPIDTQQGVYKTKTARGKEYSFDLHRYKMVDGRERIVLSAGDPKELVDAGAIIRRVEGGVVVETIHGGDTGFKGLGGVLARQIRKHYGRIIPETEAPLSPAGRKATEKLAARTPTEVETPTPKTPAERVVEPRDVELNKEVEIRYGDQGEYGEKRTYHYDAESGTMRLSIVEEDGTTRKYILDDDLSWTAIDRPTSKEGPARVFSIEEATKIAQDDLPKNAKILQPNAESAISTPKTPAGETPKPKAHPVHEDRIAKIISEYAQFGDQYPEIRASFDDLLAERQWSPERLSKIERGVNEYLYRVAGHAVEPYSNKDVREGTTQGIKSHPESVLNRRDELLDLVESRMKGVEGAPKTPAVAEQGTKPPPFDADRYAEVLLEKNPISLSELDYYAGRTGKDPHGIPDDVWERAFNKLRDKITVYKGASKDLQEEYLGRLVDNPDLAAKYGSAVAEQRETVSSAETPKWDEKESGISYERALELEGVSDYPRRSAGLAHFDELTPQEKLSVIAAQERELAAAKLETREEYKQARGYGAISRRLGTKNIGGMDRYKAAQAREKLLEQQVAKLKTRTKIEPAEQREVAPTTEVAPETPQVRPATFRKYAESQGHTWEDINKPKTAEGRKLLDQLRGEFEALPKTVAPEPIGVVGRYVSKAKAENKAKDEFLAGGGREFGSGGPDTKYIINKMIVEGYDFYINTAKPKFDAWAKEMRDRFGETVEPHLRRVYAGITGTREADIPAEKPAETIPEREPTFREETSIRNAATKELREDIGLADLPPAERKSREESIENAQRKGLVDKTDEIADRIIKAGREEGLSLDEEAAFLVKTRELENQWEAAYRADPKDPAIKDIKAELDKLTKASNMGGTEIGRALAFRQAMVNRDFKLINLVRNVEKARERPVTEKELATFDKIIKERDAAIAERDALMAQQQPPSVEKFVAEEKIKIRQRGVTRSRADLQSERIALKAELGELFKVPSAKEFFNSEKGEFDPKKTAQLTRILRDLARNYIEDGVLKAKDVADAVYKEIKDVSTITRDEVDDLVGRYGQVKQPTRDPIEQKLNEITAILAATSGKRDVLEKAIRAARSGQRREKPSEDLRRANRELDDAMRQMGPELGRTPYDVTRQKATPLDKAKTTARNRIEQLQKWIADGKREVGQRSTIIADTELTRLKAERDGLERAARLLDDPAADAKAVERRLGELSKLIRETEAKVRVGQVKPEQKEGARSLWSPEIGAMEQEHATLRKVLSDMRAEAGRAERAAAKAGESETPFYGAEQSWSAFEAEANRSLRRVKQLEAKAAEYERRVREQDFSEKVTTRKPTTYNDAVRRAQLKVAKAENQYRQEEARAMGGHWARNISGMMKAGLLGPKTMVKNFFGTFGWGMFEEQGRIFAGLMDNAISMGRQAAGKGAQRGIMGLSPTAVIESMGYGSTVGGRQAIDILKRGASEELMERHQYGEIYFGRTGKPKLDTTLKALELSFNGTYRIMSASDRLFYQTQHRRNLIDRATVMAHNEGLRGAERRTRAEELIKQADEIKAKTDRGEKIPEKIARLDADAKFDALVSTFNNDNQLSTRVKNFRRKVKDPRSDRTARQLDRSNALMNLGLDFLVPFDRTPTNVISRIVEASPLGAIKNVKQIATALKNGGMDAEAQRQFSRTFGRASAGTLNMALGAWLYGKVVTIDDKDQAWLDLGFTKINLNTISPLGNLIGFGARMAKAYGKENASWGDYAKPALKEVTNFPILRASQPVAEAVQDPERSIPKTAARYAGMAVPYSGTLRTIAEATDTETDRKPKGFSETLKMGIPGLRQQVPVDVKGRAKQQKASLIEQKRNKQITESDLKALVRDEVITEQDMLDIMREGKLTPMQSRIANAQHPETALDQYEKMSDEQRREVKEIMRKRGEGLINSKRLTPDQRKEFRQRLKDVGIRY